jgi:hypothetical protein
MLRVVREPELPERVAKLETMLGEGLRVQRLQTDTIGRIDKNVAVLLDRDSTSGAPRWFYGFCAVVMTAITVAVCVLIGRVT